METIWFCLVAIMLAAYVVLDGFDLGAGVIHLFAARSDSERRSLLASIGPVWDGNEVWLLAAGGTLYFAFPGLYAAGFSGFYLALMVVLWLLMLRGISIEFRSHLKSDLWRPFWDFTFCAASALLVIFYGAALGNVVRGVPLDHDGYFFLPLWTNLVPGENPGIIDWYTVLIGVTALFVLTMHGALWVSLKTTEEVCCRARKIACGMFWPVSAATVTISVASFAIQPHLWERFSQVQLLWIFPLMAATGLIAIRLTLNVSDLMAFLGSCTFIVGLLCSAAFGLYPILLPSISPAGQSLTVANVAASHYGLAIGLRWWIPGFLLAATYSVIAYRVFAGRVNSELSERNI